MVYNIERDFEIYLLKARTGGWSTQLTKVRNTPPPFRCDFKHSLLSHWLSFICLFEPPVSLSGALLFQTQNKPRARTWMLLYRRAIYLSESWQQRTIDNGAKRKGHNYYVILVYLRFLGLHLLIIHKVQVLLFILANLS